MSDYWCFSISSKDMFNHLSKKDDVITQLAKIAKDNNTYGVLQGVEKTIFIFGNRKERNTAMMKAKDLGIKSVHHAYLTDKQIERVEEYYSNIN